MYVLDCQKSYENMNEFYNDYVSKMKKLNELFEEASRNISRMNDLYRDLVKVNENMYNLYTQYINHFRKLNQQWIESFFSESTNAREGRDKGYHGREERIRFTIEGQ
jgi:hypothetical protein